MADQYRNFASLAANETRGVHYEIYRNDRGTSIVVIAPHGGFIERGTSEIVRAIAGEDFSSYCFEGLIEGRPHRELHITSHHFDEPDALKLVCSAETSIAIHGRKDREDRETSNLADVIASYAMQSVPRLRRQDLKWAWQPRNGQLLIVRISVTAGVEERECSYNFPWICANGC